MLYVNKFSEKKVVVYSHRVTEYSNLASKFGTNSTIKCKLSSLKFHKHAKTVTTNLPMR